MRKLTWKLVLPMTVISFAIFTKWWYVDVFDGADEVLSGFPFPYVCPGWHTSLSWQIFVLPLVIDILCYFAFWWVFIFIGHRFIEIKLNNGVVITLLSVSGLLLVPGIFFATNSDNVFSFQRTFEMQVHETGYEFIWQSRAKPDYDKYHPVPNSD